MKAPGHLGGALLAGGRSRRMGRNKATLRVGGSTLWRRQLRTLCRAGVWPVFVVLRPRQHSLGYGRFELRDTLAGAGPLAGIEAALAATASPWLAVLAVDMPRVTPAWFAGLARHCRPGRGAVYRGADGIEPLAAIYPREALAVARRRLARRQLAVRELVNELVRAGRMKVVRLPAALAPQAANWNRPADQRRADRGADVGANGRSAPRDRAGGGRKE